MSKLITEENYGKWLVFLGFIGCTVYSGCLLYAYSLFVQPLQTEFGWARTWITGGFTCQVLCNGIVSPFVGKVVDKFGARRVIVLGGLVTAAGFLDLTVLNSLVMLFLGSALVGIGTAGVGPVSCTAIISHNFTGNRGLAVGIAAMGIGAGGFIVPPMLGWQVIPKFGWQGGFVAMAILSVMIIPAALLILKKHSIEMASADVGEQQKEAESAVFGKRNKQLLSFSFACLMLTFFFNQLGIAGVLISQVPHLQDIGFPVAMASAALGTVGLVSAFAKMIFGWLCDKIHPRLLYIIGVSMAAAGTLCLWAIDSQTPGILLWVYGILFGIGAGGWLPTMSMLVSRNYGLSFYGYLFGIVTFALTIGMSIGPLLAGFGYDLSDSYHIPFIFFTVCFVISIPTVLGVRPVAAE